MGWWKQQSQPKGVCLQSCARLDAFSISCQRWGMASGAASQSALAPARCQAQCFRSSLTSKLGQTQGHGTIFHTLNCMKMLEKIQLLPAAKGLVSCLVRWELGEAQPVVFIPPVSPPGSADNKKRAVTGWWKEEMCICSALPRLCQRKNEPIHT